MTIKELVQNLIICSNPNVSCFGCTNYNECTLGGVEYVSKNRAALMENSAKVIEAFMELCKVGAFEIDNYSPDEFNVALINDLWNAFQEEQF
ncbi:MAG: hypothetical protein J6Y28_03990 [Acholeplasmatales bacterium]|nr:hypothetical protein [Methanobrevibacter sp.]MBP5445313.1 hypothetical protein [Acholeplasmatales bacterium]